MKLSQVLFFLPSALALPSLHSLGNVGVSSSNDCYLDFPLPGGDVTPCPDGYDTTPIESPIGGDGNMCCKTNTAQGNDDLEKAVTKPSNICLRILLPADAKCPDRFEVVPVGDSGFITCCLPEPDDTDDLIVVQDSKVAHKGL